MILSHHTRNELLCAGRLLKLLVGRLRTPPGDVVMASDASETHGAFGFTRFGEDWEFEEWRWEERTKFCSGVSAEPTKKVAAVESNAAAVTPNLAPLEELRVSGDITVNTSFAKWTMNEFGLRRKKVATRPNQTTSSFSDTPNPLSSALPGSSQGPQKQFWSTGERTSITSITSLWVSHEEAPVVVPVEHLAGPDVNLVDAEIFDQCKTLAQAGKIGWPHV